MVANEMIPKPFRLGRLRSDGQCHERMLIGLIGLILVLTSIYLVMPPSGRVRPRHALVGGIAVGILWEATRRILWRFGGTDALSSQ